MHVFLLFLMHGKAVHFWSGFKPSVNLHTSGYKVIHDIATELELLLPTSLANTSLIQLCIAERTEYETNYMTHHKNTVCKIHLIPLLHGGKAKLILFPD